MKKELKVISYVHFLDTDEVAKYDDLTDEEKKAVARQLASQAEKVKLDIK